jgi:hypothetical protein
MRPNRCLLVATAALVVGATVSFAADDAALALSQQLRQQADALHAAAMPPEQGPRPPRLRNWMLRKEIKNMGGLADQMAVLAGRERPKKFWMRAHQTNIELTNKRIKFGIFSGGARHIEEAVKGAYDPVVATVKALHDHMWNKTPPGGGGAPVESEPPPVVDEPPPVAEPPPVVEEPPPAEDPPAEDEPPAGDEPPADDEPPAGDEPPADDEPPAGDEPPADDAPPADEPPPAADAGDALDELDPPSKSAAAE